MIADDTFRYTEAIISLRIEVIDFKQQCVIRLIGGIKIVAPKFKIIHSSGDRHV